MLNGLRTTIIGGIIFLVPIIFVLLILGKAYGIALQVAAPISKLFPIESFGGIALANILAAFAVIAVCYTAGLIARSSLISAKVAKMDQFLTRAIPTYHFTKKGFIDSVGNKSFEDDWKVVWIGDPADKRALGFEISKLANGDVLIFQPNTPNTSTGFVWSVPAHHVELIDIAPRDLSKHLKSYGIGLPGDI
ncbi:hypothetical protein [Pelagimonas varians]|uniref:DUF502 domain-containing protein n=1 Tax=Pelagimonas varians TaxID=696760 RepID=A0A238KZ79_9RHOB|nr:hypothetical protein [Pelagimonas varians]PYG27525.1 putative membrane protein [Pelagimonas varians]SMX48115.1 hypothetical protein PEV8663_03743 [Pelagimonas varians]